MKRLMILCIIPLLMCSGCAGLGFDKKATFCPDELFTTIKHDPQQSGRLEEIDWGLKWKLK